VKLPGTVPAVALASLSGQGALANRIVSQGICK
jgi:hypothetical protein